MKFWLWISGSAAAVASAVVVFLAASGAQSGDIPAIVKKPPTQLSGAGKAQLAAVVAEEFGQRVSIPDLKVVTFEAYPATIDGQQVALIELFARERACGTASEARAKEMSASQFEHKIIGGQVCWEAVFRSKQTKGTTLSLARTFFEQRLGLPQPEIFRGAKCNDTACVLFQLEVVDAQREYFYPANEGEIVQKDNDARVP